VTFTPMNGLWWNPNESGTGYNVDVQHGASVVTMYSYTAAGDPVWYLAVGAMMNVGNGVAASGTLDKYRGGPCASCMYQGEPTMTGNDGSITINFASPRSATVQLPGGRVTQIQPEVW
jgi:hypothetical protein